jgi:hypothetical protein
MKNNELDYRAFTFGMGDWLTMPIYVGVVILIIMAVSNGANITDGIDGLAAGTSAIIGLTLALLAYVSGNVIFSDYLEHHVHSRLRRIGDLLCSICGSMRRVPVVQCISRPGFYGRHRKSFARSHHCCFGADHQKRTPDTFALWHIPD